MTADASGRRVVIVGGGLAGLAAAAALVDRGFLDAGGSVRLLEMRRKVGGRAASFEDAAAGELVDACQHVALGCCTNFLDLCMQAGIGGSFRRDRTLWFIGVDNVRAACSASQWLPPPLHLAPLLSSMKHFGVAEKMNLAFGLLRLARYRRAPERDGGSQEEATHAWLVAAGQKPSVIELFWRPVIESAVGESLELVGLAAARKVIVDGFLAHRSAIDLHVPVAPLGTLFGEGIAGWLGRRGVSVETGEGVTRIVQDAAGRVAGVEVQAPGRRTLEIPCDACLLAVPWRQAARLVPDAVPGEAARFAGSPITAVHLWFDAPAVDLPHAVLVGRLSQWVFRPNQSNYCQVVISASRSLAGVDRQEIVDRVVAEVREVFPAARTATLTAARVVTDPTAVLSVRPGVAAYRPGPTTTVDGLYLAGDWTATGWPSTMEGAVRSGRIAADAFLRSRGFGGSSLVPDLPKNLAVRLLVGPDQAPETSASR